MTSTPRIQVRALLAAVLRESRASRGRLLFFVGCLGVGVAAVVGVAALVGAMHGGLGEESRELLAADLRVSARRALPEELETFFADVPHARADVRELAAMAAVDEQAVDEQGEAAPTTASANASRLVELKVVDGGYPFYGELELERAEVASVAQLGADAVFAAPDLAAALGVDVGDVLRIGGAPFRIAGLVLDEPDRMDFAMTLGPRVFMTAEGLARTDLLESLSRVRHRALYRIDGDSDPARLQALAEDLEASVGDPSFLDVRVHSDAQPNVTRSIGRVEDFLGLVALLSLLLGGIGVAQIVRAWLAGRAQSVAVLRSLGLRAREIALLYLGHVALLALLGSVGGGLVGAAAPWLARAVAPEVFRGGTEHLWQPLAFARGVGLGLFVALAFSVPALTAVWSVPPAAVLRAEAVPLRIPGRVRFAAWAALFLGVLFSARVQGGAWLPAWSFSAGVALLAGLLWLGARGALALSASLRRGVFRERLGPYLEHGFAALTRPGAGTTGAIVALGLGVMVVVSMFLIERQLGEALRTALPEDAPSVFLMDIQPDQWDGVRAGIDAHAPLALQSVPVVMARLRAIDGTPVTELAAEREQGGDRGRGSWVLTREQRLTWLDALPDSNTRVAPAEGDGPLWRDAGAAEVSLEVDFAEDLGAELGSTLTFDVQGVPVDLLVTSLREVEWQSFEINFFLIVEPGVLEDAPHFRIAAARVEPPDAEFVLQNELTRDFPNVTLLRVRPILEKVAGVLERVGFGVRSLGSFTILSGLVILAGAVATTALRRVREAALLKALGVTRSGVARLFAVEYALIGLLAGSIGAAGALVLSWVFLERGLELEAELPGATVPVAALACAVLAAASGLCASARALRARPLDTLRG